MHISADGNGTDDITMFEKVLLCVGLYKCGRRGEGLKRALAPPPPQPPHPFSPKGNEKVSGLTGNNPRHPPRGPKQETENNAHGASTGQAPEIPKCYKHRDLFLLLDRLVRKKKPPYPRIQSWVEQEETCFIAGGFFFAPPCHRPVLNIAPLG